MKSSKDLLKEIASQILVYELRERDTIAMMILEYEFGISRIDIALGKPIDISVRQDVLQDVISKINQHFPIQYIFNQAWFYSRAFYVDSNVLIPRPETEELVHLIIHQNKIKRDLHVADFCTGSGCIAITLALELHCQQVLATDISRDALHVARENALRLNAAVDFKYHDLFTNLNLDFKLDVIVSNPPYITLAEKSEMQENVLLYEPSLALFVPDDNPIQFYKAIVLISAGALKPGGQVYFEINPLHASSIQNLLEQNGFTQVQIIMDLHGKNRFAAAVR